MTDSGTTSGPDDLTARMSGPRESTAHVPGPGDTTVRAEAVDPPAGAPDQGQDAEPDPEPFAYPYPLPGGLGQPSPPALPDPQDQQDAQDRQDAQDPQGVDGGAGAGTPVAPSPADPGGSPPPWSLRRHRRQTRIFVVALAAVVVIGLGAFALFKGTLSWPFGGTPQASTTTACPTVAPSIQAAGLTHVRVYNASNRRGLALSVARELQKRGFVVPEQPRNDPQEAKFTTAAVIRHGPGGLTAARTVATQVKGTVALQPDGRLGEAVDLVLGQSFGIVDPATGAAALKRRPAATTCSPAG